METVSIPMCPMAKMCKGMMEKPFSSFVPIVSGVMLIVMGMAILLEPRILVWFVAVVLIIIGIAMLILAKFMRKTAER